MLPEMLAVNGRILRMPIELTPTKMAIRVAARKLASLARARRPMMFPTYSQHVANRIEKYHDEIRYSTIALALQRLELDKIPGAYAEVGVFQGATSSFIHQQVPYRDFYLFDTFEGFPSEDEEAREDPRFAETSVEAVSKYLGRSSHLHFRKGFFPETSAGLEDEKFAFVMLDVDYYSPALATLQFFYPRMSRGGYFMMHDFNTNESDCAVSRAAYEFMADKPEMLIEIPDFYGSALFRKI
ncbi:MAG: TylF/MycF/NovP-related O-methyltransferase [Edaphobacter sp.]